MGMDYNTAQQCTASRPRAIFVRTIKMRLDMCCARPVPQETLPWVVRSIPVTPTYLVLIIICFTALLPNPIGILYSNSFLGGPARSSRPPPVHAFDFYLALGSALPQLADFIGFFLTRAVALSRRARDRRCASFTGIRTPDLSVEPLRRYVLLYYCL